MAGGFLVGHRDLTPRQVSKNSGNHMSRTRSLPRSGTAVAEMLRLADIENLDDEAVAAISTVVGAFHQASASRVQEHDLAAASLACSDDGMSAAPFPCAGWILDEPSNADNSRLCRSQVCEFHGHQAAGIHHPLHCESFLHQHAGNMVPTDAGRGEGVRERMMARVILSVVECLGSRSRTRIGIRRAPRSARHCIVVSPPRQVPFAFVERHLSRHATGHPDGRDRAGIRLSLRPYIEFMAVAVGLNCQGQSIPPLKNLVKQLCRAAILSYFPTFLDQFMDWSGSSPRRTHAREYGLTGPQALP